MDKDLFLQMSCYQGISCNLPELDPVVSVKRDITELDQILNEIFSVDPISGLPKGDISYYLSPNGNPAVKEWLINNLLKPRSNGNSSIDSLTDDMIEEYSRKPGESYESYSTRMRGYYDEASKLISDSIVPGSDELK